MYGSQRPKKRICDPTVILQRDDLTEEGPALHGPAFLEEFSSFSRVLSEVGIGPIIAWGDIAMMFSWHSDLLYSKCFSQH
jgi:hypothetical protein